MTTQIARALKIRDGQNSNSPLLAALRAATLQIRSEIIEITEITQAHNNRALLDQAAVSNVRVTGVGLLTGQGSAVLLGTRALAQTRAAYRCEFDQSAVLVGDFLISLFEIVAEQGDMQIYRLVLDSTSAITLS